MKTEPLIGNINEYKDYSMRELIQLIEYNKGVFPEDALQEIITRKEP
ncbi:MAG: hypothetical protein N2645_21155 [Clostridia bacterium]|nr:hypothetical protein [Clostridia bacterium]